MKKLSLAMVMVFMLIVSTQVLAQPVLNYGSTTIGTLSPDLPIAIYTFKGEEGDQVAIQVIGLSSDFDLSTTLQNGTEILSVKEYDPFVLGSTDVRIDYRLPETSTYVIFISSPSEQIGDFAVKLYGQALVDKRVQSDATISLDGDELQYYSFNNPSNSITRVSLASTASEFEFHTLVYDSEGRIIHTSLGTSTQINVNEADDYEIAIRAVDPKTEGVITIELEETQLATEPLVEPTPPPATLTSSYFLPTQYVNPIFDVYDKCAVFSEGFPNIRTSPSTTNAIITQIQPGIAYDIFGQYLDWYQVLVPIYGAGWVSNKVVETGGDCETIPFISPDNTPVLPTHTPTITNTPTPTSTATSTSTATPTATSTITTTPTTTDTPRPSATVVIQTAPEDANMNSPLIVLLGHTVSVSDFVSYPNGDRDDLVNWDISGMDEDPSDANGRAHLIITATCFGDDTTSLEFTVGDQIYQCGDILVDEDINFDTKAGSVMITAFRGEDAYTQWVLTGTATRLE